MNLILRSLGKLRWFFLSTVVIVLIAAVLNHVGQANLDEGLSGFIANHQSLLLSIRLLIIVSFVLFWPYFVSVWSEKYNWPEDYAKEVEKRRWRYLIWLIVVNLTFQML